MIRYEPLINAWVSGKNPDHHGSPTTNLTGDDKVCVCASCVSAYANGFGENHAEVHQDV